jgi:gas vesicle protein
MIPEFLLKTLPASIENKIFSTERSRMVLQEAANYARWSQSLQENKLTSDSFAGQLTLDLIETAPQIVAQYAAAFLTGGASTLPAIATFAAMGAGQSATSQYFESLNTNMQAGVSLEDASMRAFRDAAIAGTVTGATEAAVGKILGVGGLSGKTVGSVRKALGEATLKTYVKGSAFGIMTEGTQETADQFGSEFLINLIRSGEPEFKEFYDANPDWVMQTVKNSLYAGLVGGIIGAPSGVVTRFANKRQAQSLVSTLDQIKGALPENDPRIRMLNRDSLTSEEVVDVIKWMADQDKKLGIRSAKDIQVEKAIGAGLDMDGVADEQLSAVIIAGNDGTTTARLRGAPNEQVGKYGNVDFVITPAMAADELTRRAVLTGATPAGARTALVANQGAVDPNTAVEERVYESGDKGDDLDLMGETLNPASNYVSTGATPESTSEFVRENPRLAARLARMTQPISRKMMEQMAGRSFAGNSFMFRQTFQEGLRAEVEAQQQARDPRRIQEGVDNSRRQAREEAVKALTGLSDVEISRVALGVNPRRAKAISRILADAQRDAANVTAGPMTLAETERRSQTAEAAAAIRRQQTGSDIASIPALSQIASGDVARNRQAKLAKEKLDKLNASRKELANSYALFNSATAVKNAVQEALDNFKDVVANGTEDQITDAWLQVEFVHQLVQLANEDANISKQLNANELIESIRKAGNASAID